MQSIFGIDEVGRGPIAGPVAVGVFRLDIENKNFKILVKKTNLKLRDSKKLSHAEREKWFEVIKKWKKEGKCDYKVTLVSAAKIDSIGIVPAIKRALSNSIYKLKTSDYKIVLLDGGLKAPKEFARQKTIIKGDEKEPAIALASICAKVTRDRYMDRVSKIYPKYNFYMHKGYGTKAHYEAIYRYGITDIHRKTFLKKVL
ncbi:ribonuclease HII [Candidatus Nomurabacteria bacterium]|nr:MAG: ribonuclease HII [Candidatus Nomurabacteria bacterium]